MNENNKTSKQMKHEEFRLQQEVCKYLNYQYPDVLYFSDTIASANTKS